LKSNKIIFVIFLQILVGTLLASNPENIINDLKFELVQLDYEEGIVDNESIYHFLEDDNGIFWIGSTKGFYRFNGSSIINITTRVNRKQNDLITSQWTSALAKDQQNKIWFGTTSGLYIFDQETDNCISIPLEQPENVTRDNVYIRSIAFDEQVAYIGTRDGLYEVDQKTLKVIGSFMTNGEPYLRKGTQSVVWTIQPNISDQDVWFSTRGGMHRKNNDNHIDTFSIGPNREDEGHYFLNSVVLKNEIFIADYKYGVVRFNLDAKSYDKYRLVDSEWSRAKSIIHLEDDLLMINAETKGIAIFDANSEKLHWLETNRIIKAGRYNLYKDSAGYIWLASDGQIYRSNLSFPITSDKKAASLDIGYAFANGQRLNSTLGQPEVLKLEHTKNNLQINFSLSNKWLFKDLSYQYQWNNKEWANIMEKNKLSLFDLRAGKHSLSIRAKDNGSVVASSSTTIEVHRPFKNSPLFYTLIILGIIGLSSGVYFYNKKQYQEKLKLKSQYEARLATLESQALRSQINPHFIFNTLNSIKYYSIEKSPEETSDFISSFSTLIRRILENSKKNLITLNEEIDTLRNYTDIEALRFHERFDVEYNVDTNIDIERFLVPPMIIQPFIENAIWHGLMHKSGNRKLKINVKRKGIGVVCEIIDNGIGRKASNDLKTKDRHKSSLGMKITKERMEIINARNLTNNSFAIEDLVDENGKSVGTKVSINFLPKENI